MSWVEVCSFLIVKIPWLISSQNIFIMSKMLCQKSMKLCRFTHSFPNIVLGLYGKILEAGKLQVPPALPHVRWEHLQLLHTDLPMDRAKPWEILDAPGWMGWRESQCCATAAGREGERWGRSAPAVPHVSAGGGQELLQERSSRSLQPRRVP